MNRYLSLDPRTQLEQTITADLNRALNKRGFQAKHNGTTNSSTPGGLPDIEVWDENIQINVEVTQTTKSNADREFLPVKDHLEKSKEKNPTKKCFAIYISPETHYRMISAIRDHDIQNAKKQDLKIMPLSFDTFELFITKLIETHKEQYPKNQIMSLFDNFINFLDDERILRIIHENLFSDDLILKKEIDIREENRHQQTVEDLVKDLLKLENKLREELGITHTDAIRDIIFLVFMKLYEEKREFENKENRFKKTTFPKFQEYINDYEKGVFELFRLIKEDRHLKSAKVFTETDNLSEKLDDKFVFAFFIEAFEKYHFYTTKVDGIGAAYEVLGMRAGKDVKAGQFFTPENVVRFMVQLTELDSDDTVLDPACGTGRFLIHSMHDMVNKVNERNTNEKITDIKEKQLFGTDYDSNVAKLAKMNMYIHGDGKTNIKDEDGLLLMHFDNKIDVILTNPPLGDQSYLKTSYDSNFKNERMQVIPKIDITKEKMVELKTKILALEEKLESQKAISTHKQITKLQKNIKENKDKLAKLESQEKPEYEIHGSQMKGGALFVNASWHYLKSVRNKDLPPEWRGGKLLIILDEGVLNTGDYAQVREFIKDKFYIKAVISLTRDTFIPISHTSTKTSILYCIKKEDSDAVQTEPIFFAHVDKVGLDTKGKVCENHLFNSGKNILQEYFSFKKKVLNAYVGQTFKKEKFGE